MAEDDLLTFDELRTVQNQERSADTLQELDDDFFDRARDYLDLKRDPESHLENREYRNARRVIEDIVDQRQKKIMKLAFLSVKSDLHVENLLPREEELFEQVRDIIRDHRGAMQERIFEVDGTTTADDITSTPDPTEPAEEEPPEPEPHPEADDSPSTDDPAHDTDPAGDPSAGEDAPVAPVPEDDEDGDAIFSDDADEEAKDTPDHEEDDSATDEDADGTATIFGGDDTSEADETGEDDGNEDDEAEAEEDSDTGGEADGVHVRLEESVPAFMGTDLEPYGPYDPGDETRIPEKNASILVEKGKAERVE